jgi:hypothetical protein
MQYGLYPAFLSVFDFTALTDWQAKNPALAQVYYTQAVLLAATMAFFLFIVLWTSTAFFLVRCGLLLALSFMLWSPLVVVWPAWVLNETLTISGLILLLSCCLYADVRRNSLTRLVVLLLAGTALIFVRDPFIFLTLALTSLICVNAVFSVSKTLPRLCILCLACAVLVVTAIETEPMRGAGKRSGGFDVLASLATVIQMRILPDEVGRRFFVERGMPASDIILARSGTASIADPMLETSIPDEELREKFPGLIEYRAWLRANGARVYLEFLLTHPGYLLRSLWRSPTIPREPSAADLDLSIAGLFSRPVLAYGSTPWPDRMANFLLAPFGWFIPMIYILAASIKYLADTVRRHAASPVDMLAISAAVGLFLSYHSDAWDVWRHTLPFLLAIYLALILRGFDVASWVGATLRRKYSSPRRGISIARFVGR